MVTNQSVVEHGAPGWIRTSGLRLRRATLYPAELRVLSAYAALTREILRCEPKFLVKPRH